MIESTQEHSGVRDVVIIGGGPAAHRLADSLHARDTGRALRVTVVGEELHHPYDRVALSTRLADGAVDLTLQPSSMWDDDHIRLVTGERVDAIDRDAQTATTSSGRTLHWDELVFATGSSAPVPELPGRNHARVYRTIDDVDALVGPATPQFAFQIRARVRELVAGLPEGD
ncbi:MAG TPA: FAD-dependent oxidoreductase, partial [Agromyces sp.]